MKTLYELTNGYKTIVGAVIALGYLAALNLGFAERNSEVEALIVALLGLGLGHKVIKSA